MSNKPTTGAGKGSARRTENFKQIQSNWEEIDWGKKCVFCGKKGGTLVKNVNLFGEFYYNCFISCK